METIKLDLIPGKKMPSLHASQYDDGREHGIDLFENGVVYKLDGTETLTINERKGDDCICSLDIVNTFAESNHIVFASTEQMCAVWGNNICELVIAKGEKTIGTLNFILEIEQSPTEDGIESESEIKNLKRQIEAITEEVIGDDYYTAEETDEAIATAIEGKADTTYVDTELGKKADKSNTYTKTEVDEKIDELPEPMIFKGTLGVGGTIQALPTASAENEGWMFKCITAGTYAGLTLKVGDTVTCFNPPNTSTYYWDKTGSQDTDTDTWRNIKVNGVEKLGNGISSGAVDFVGSENIEVEFDANGNKVGIKTKNIYTKEQVDDIVYNILPDDTASGSVANFETDLALPIKSLEIDVNAKQDLHGEANPYPAGGGKNLYPLITPDAKNGITLTNDNGVVTINGTATADTYFDIDNLNISLPSGSKLYLCAFNSVAAETRLSLFLITNNIGNPQVNMNNANAILDTTISADAIGTRLRFRVPNGATYSNFKLSPYLQIGGNAPTSFLPYENICPISGWSEISLTKCHKNLYQYDENKVSTGTTTQSTIRAFLHLGFKGVTSLTFSASLKSGASITQSDYLNIGRLRKSDGLLEILSAFITPNATTTRTLSISSDDEVVLMSLENPTVIKSILSRYDIQIEVGSSATPYEPYNGTTEVINLGGTYYGGHYTQDKAGHRQFEVTYKRELLKNWIWTRNSTEYAFAYFSTTNVTDKANNKNFVCEIFANKNNYRANLSNSEIGVYNNTTGLRRFCVRCDEATTSEEFNSIIGDYAIIYELATPIIIDLPDGEPITTLIGTNNIFADTGDTSVVFKNSVNGYVEKKIANVQALTLNT